MPNTKITFFILLSSNPYFFTVEVNDGGNGSGLCHFQVFQGSDASGTPLNQFWNSAYYNESSHTYTLNDLPEGQICVLAHDQAGNFSQHGFMLA